MLFEVFQSECGYFVVVEGLLGLLWLAKPKDKHGFILIMHSRRVSILDVQGVFADDFRDLTNRVLLSYQDSRDLSILLRLRKVKFSILKQLSRLRRILHNHAYDAEFSCLSDGKRKNPQMRLLQMTHKL